MPKVFTSKTQKTGEIGEHIAVRYLQNKGYSVIERNYTKKWGEIDIVVKKGDKLHFVEVKSKTGQASGIANSNGAYKAEDGMHAQKIARLRRTIQTYLLEHRIGGDWQFDLITVQLSGDLGEARVVLMEDIIL